MSRLGTVVAAMAAAALLLAGCSSASPPSHRSDDPQTGAGGRAALAAQAPANSASDAIELGFVAAPADGIALVGIQDNLYREDLGAAVELNPVAFPTSSSVGLALKEGRLDAAYLDPVTAVSVWQATHGRIRVVAGAASIAGRSGLVLAVASRFLAEHPLLVRGLLKGQIQAMELLDTDPLSARRMTASELAALGKPEGAGRFARASAGITFSCDPLQHSVFAQAQQAAKAGMLKAVTSLDAMYNLGPVDELLISAGLRPVSGTVR
jgi:hypothetical protein